MLNRPNLNVVKDAPVPDVPIRDFGNRIKNSSLANRAKELDVFGVCPEQTTEAAAASGVEFGNGKN